MNTEPLTLSVKTAAKKLGLGRSSMYQAIARGEVPVLKIGSRLLIPIAALQKMLDAKVPENKP